MQGLHALFLDPSIQLKPIKLREPADLHKGNSALRDHGVQGMGGKTGIGRHFLNI